MSDFGPKEKKIIREMVDHYENIDVMRLEVKEQVEDLFKIQMYDFIKNNYPEFIKNQNEVIQAFIVKFMRDNSALFGKSLNEGIRYTEAIL